jgi:hypothetical protein
MGPEAQVIENVAQASNYLVPVYVTYTVISVALTVWLARVLSKNGAIFLRDVFAEKPDLAEAVNRLLVVGFYLVNLGYAALLLRADPAANIIGAIETLAWKLGLLLMSLAAMHFVNMFVFHRIRRSAIETNAPPRGFYPPTAGTMPAASPHSAFDLIDSKAQRERMAEATS